MRVVIVAIATICVPMASSDERAFEPPLMESKEN